MLSTLIRKKTSEGNCWNFPVHKKNWKGAKNVALNIVSADVTDRAVVDQQFEGGWIWADEED